MPTTDQLTPDEALISLLAGALDRDPAELVEEFRQFKENVQTAENELTYEEHKEAKEQEEADECAPDETEGVNVDDLDNITKLGIVIEENLNGLVLGHLGIETGEELLALTRAVFTYEQNKDK